MGRVLARHWVSWPKVGDEPAPAEKTKIVAEEQKLVEQIAVENAKEYLEKHLKRVLDAYLGAATGTNVVFDPVTCRHFIDKFLPAIAAHRLR